jgi:hypothetical protein
MLQRPLLVLLLVVLLMLPPALARCQMPASKHSRKKMWSLQP